VYEVPEMITSEPVFVASPDAKSEDDGVLLVVMFDTKNVNSYLAVIDAKTMKEIGRAIVPKTVPLGFHGNFFGNDRKSSTFDQ